MYSGIKGPLIRIFKTKNFARWAKKEKVLDKALSNAVLEIEHGIIDADLGGGFIKKRIAKSGQGKRSGYRVLLAFKSRDRSVFVFGFSKSDKENIDSEEKELYRKLSKIYLTMSMSMLDKLCNEGKLYEVIYEKER